MSIFAATNTEIVTTRRRRERAERRAQAATADREYGIDDVLNDERPTSTPLSAGESYNRQSPWHELRNCNKQLSVSSLQDDI